MKQSEIKDLPNLDDYSYANIFSVYQDGDLYFYNLLNSVNFPVDINPNYYNEYELPHGMSWTLISYRMYKTIKLWWLICAVNQITNPLEMPPAGTKIKILTVSAVNQVLRKLNIST